MPVVVSVIIAAYNAGKYIEETITSVLSQTYPYIECILVDDGSTDNTSKIITRFGNRIKYIYQDNAERSKARNNGVAHSSGKYINFLDADDLFSPDKIADQVIFLENHQDCDVVYSKVRYFKDYRKRSYYSVNRITPTGDILDQLIYGNFINLGSPLVRRKAFNRIGGFDSDRADIILNEDWDFLLRLAISGSRFGFIQKYHLFYRVYEGNTSQNRLRSMESKLRITEKIINQYSDLLEKKGVNLRRVLMHAHAEYGRRLILEGNVLEGQKLMANACKMDIPNRKYFQSFLLVTKIFGHRFLNLTKFLRKSEL